MKITFLGHSCFLIESMKKTIIIDPFLSSSNLSKTELQNLKVDAVIITHGHADHIGDAVTIAKNSTCPIVSNFEVAMFLSKENIEVHPMNIGGTHKFHWGLLKFTPAFHSSSIEVNEGEFIYGGMPAGILLTMNGKTFYHSGDTGLFYDMKVIGENNNINVAALPIGDNFTLGIDDAVIAAKWLNADIYIPMHYNTFPLIKQDPHIFINKLENEGLKGIVVQLNDSIFI